MILASALVGASALFGASVSSLVWAAVFWWYSRKMADKLEIMAWRPVHEELYLMRYLREMKNKQAAIAEAIHVNRSAWVRKWLRHMGISRESFDLSERVQKLFSELVELDTAATLKDRRAVADAVADMQYILESFPLLMGYDGHAVFRAVHDSNMTKSAALFKQDGRGKGECYTPPDLSNVRGL